MLFRSFVRASAACVRERNSRMATVPQAFCSEIIYSSDYSKVNDHEKHPTGPAYEFKVGKPNKHGPPQFGRLDAACHYPLLIIATPTIQNIEGYSRTYVATKTDSCVFTKDYFVDVPFEVNPGDLFRVLITGEEYIVKCPNIHTPGERIAVTMLDK